MKFQVPQFIEVEDKIFGPFTFKQFIYLAGGAAICVLFMIFLPKFIAIILSLPVAAFALALAFYKINNKPFIDTVEAFINYSLTSKLYIWKKGEEKVTPVAPQTIASGERPVQQIFVPKLSDSKLKDLTWNLDVAENQNPVTPNTQEGNLEI